MSLLVLRPLGEWIYPTTSVRAGSQFSAGWTDTKRLLCAEVDHLTDRPLATDVIVQIDVPAEDWRLDGRLRKGALVRSPRVVVSFDSRNGPMRLSCDRFDAQGREGWKHNVRAIALALEALRRVDRYGIGQGADQYVGFTAIGTGREMPAPMTADQAEAILRAAAGSSGHDSRSWQDLYRLAARSTHPDKGGDPAHFAEVAAAYEVLTRKATL